MQPKIQRSNRSGKKQALNTGAKEFARVIATALAKRWHTEQKIKHKKNQSSQP
ncbi:hypothetical protein [Gimesia chilikensis]|uniref:Uncharacterized protein n=1 Tax=Gimesia chilikensis TaxID=2605989 RepID=A0A517PST7_9PLAN|nr:hypothetical protein [Gimesia chilikensis]QDT22431.1 hypothetical protein HG66A1_42390 [Gimesia chilikensis]